MRLHSIALQNFRQHADSRIVFDTGLTGIIGANGSGKTTILESIAWALYGQPAARGNRDSIRFNRAPARSSVRVELDFELAGHRYRVVRGLNNAELYLDGSSSPIANSITGVTDLLQRKLGMTRAEFFNTYFTGQKELNVMAAMGPTERAQFLSRVLGYERLRAAQGLVRERKKLVVAEVAGLRSAMPDPEAVARQLVECETRLGEANARSQAAEFLHQESARSLAAVEPRWQALQASRQTVQQLNAERMVAEREVTLHVTDAERIARDLAELTQSKAELAKLKQSLEPLTELMIELQALEVLAREEGKRQTLVEGEKNAASDLDRLRERHEKIKSAPELEREVMRELEQKRVERDAAEAATEAMRTEWVRDKQEAETKLIALRTQYQEIKAQRERIVELGENGICPTCSRPLGDHFRSVLDLLDSQMETATVDGNYFRRRTAQLEEMPEELKALDENRRTLHEAVGALERKLVKVQAAAHELAQVTKEMQTREERLAAVRANLKKLPPGYDAPRHTLVKTEVERLAPLDARAARLSAHIEREAQLAREQVKCAEQLEVARAKITALDLKIAAIDFSEANYAAVRAEHDRVVADARAAELAAVHALAEVNAAREGLERAHAAQRELEQTQKKLDVLLRDKRLHDELDRAYSDLRTDLNFQLRPELSELASAFLTELTDARYSELELDDQYNIIVLEDGVPKPVISGGEEDLANLVLRLAISQMIAERAGQSFSLLVLDEVFGSLDESRRHNVVELLRGLQDRFEQVILITHIESVREGLDRVVTVRYDEESGSSVVEQPDTLPIDATYDDDERAVGVA